MIKLKNSAEQIELKLSIVGYQFPNHADDNWCLVHARVQAKGQSVEIRDPALEATELLKLRNWFIGLSHFNPPHFTRLSFTEPCLAFELLAIDPPIISIGVTLSHEMKPPFKRKDAQDATHWKAAFDLNADDLTRIICDIEAARQAYPVRLRPC